MNLEIEGNWPTKSSYSFSLLESINGITKSVLDARRLAPDSDGQIVFFTEENEPIREATIEHCSRDLRDLLNHIEKRNFKPEKDIHVLATVEAKQLLETIKNSLPTEI